MSTPMAGCNGISIQTCPPGGDGWFQCDFIKLQSLSWTSSAWNLGHQKAVEGRGLSSIFLAPNCFNCLTHWPAVFLQLLHDVTSVLESIIQYFCITPHSLMLPQVCHSTFLLSNCIHFYVDLQENYLLEIFLKQPLICIIFFLS